MRTAAAIAAALITTAASAQTAPVVPTVRMEGGTLAGTTGDGIAAFKGIPYAAPPVGPLRWRAPQPAAVWTGVRSAADYGHDCVQNYPGYQPPGSAPSEDCLYLIVWKSSGAARKLPVLVWIYGGGFVNESSSRPIYQGDALARQGVVVVSSNYRLGRSGTFAHPALTRANADGGLLANYGYMDQIAAMKWVRRNIAAFGGDPDKVTIMGESAGGFSVHNLLTSPMTQGQHLFRAAIVASGGNGGGMGPAMMAQAEQVGVAFAQANGVGADAPDALARLRALPADAVRGDLALGTLGREAPRTFSNPFPDGRVAVNAADAYASGRFDHVPVIVGATSGDLGGRDGMMVKGARDIAGTLARAGVPTWYYHFSYIADAAPTGKEKGAIHADDLPYWFDTVAVQYRDKTQPVDAAMGHTIATYVTNFTKRGDPNGAGVPTWLRYRPGGTMMDFAVSGKAVAGPDPGRPDPGKPGQARGYSASNSAASCSMIVPPSCSASMMVTARW